LKDLETLFQKASELLCCSPDSIVKGLKERLTALEGLESLVDQWDKDQILILELRRENNHLEMETTQFKKKLKNEQLRERWRRHP
jgi:hypothetical protein